MFLPLYDGKAIRFIRFQWMTALIIATNVAVYLLVNVVGLGPLTDMEMAAIDRMAIAFGHVPAVMDGERGLPAGYDFIPGDAYWPTMISSAFLHADFWHLVGNMLFLWVFGDNVEDAMGHLRFLLFYLACIFASVWFHVLVQPDSQNPLIGASGAGAGVVGAYLVLHPRMKVWGLVLGRIPLRLPAMWVLGAWALYQLFQFLTDFGSQIAWSAHVGGLIAGIVLVTFMKRREVPLFDRQIVLPEAVVLEPDAELPAHVRRPRFGRDAA